jgi:hypothetical protein
MPRWVTADICCGDICMTPAEFIDAAAGAGEAICMPGIGDAAGVGEGAGL